MTSRRGLLSPLALAPLALASLVGAPLVGMAVWRGRGREEAVDPAVHAPQRFHQPWGALTQAWNALAGARVAGPIQTPEFPPDVLALDGREITLSGFMVPLSQESRHNRFLLTANPVSCPACERPRPETMAFVRARHPVPAHADVVVITGVLRLAPHEGLFYRIDGAALAG